MAQFNLEDYETVDDRLARLHGDPKFADVRIITVNHTTPIDRQAGMWVIECRIYLNALEQLNECPIATGWAFEIDGQGMANKTSALENCETSSRGRAMQALAMSGSKGGPSRQEMAKVARGVAPTAPAVPMPADFRELVTGATDLDTLRGLWKQAANGGFLDEAKQMMENRKAVLSRG